MGEAIKVRRELRHRNREWLAVKVGVSVRTIKAWEREERLPSRDQLDRIVRALGCTHGDIAIRPRLM